MQAVTAVIPRHYPAGIKCFRTITADYGYFVRVDFRDYFNIEPPTNEGNCDYDYLEVRGLWLEIPSLIYHLLYFTFYNKCNNKGGYRLSLDILSEKSSN